jgi:hypothetical protein
LQAFIVKNQNMEPRSELFEVLFDKIKEFGLNTYELSKLKALDTFTVVASSLISRLIVILVFAMFVLILNIGLGLYLGEILGKVYYGFFVVAAIDLVAGIILHYYLHKWIRKPLSDSIISEVFQSDIS